MHPVGDVRVESKIAQSFINKGWNVDWIGPARYDFATEGTHNAKIRYSLTNHYGNRFKRFTAIPEISGRLLQIGKPDLIYCPEPDSAAIALMLRPFHRTPIIFDIHENYHNSALRRWLPERFVPALSNPLRLIIAGIAKQSDFATAVNSDIAETYSTRTHTPSILRNLAHGSFAKEPKVTAHGSTTGTILRFFHGKASPGNGTDTLLEAWAKLKDRPDLKLVLIPRLANAKNDLMPNLHERITELGITESVELIDAVPHHQVPRLLDSMDVGMISYQRNLGVDSLPNRFFEYLARGLPTVTPTYSPRIKEIVDRIGCGVSVDMESPSEIAASVRTLADTHARRGSMAKQGLRAFMEELSWEAEFEPFYQKATGTDS